MVRKRYFKIGLILVLAFFFNACGITCVEPSVEKQRGEWRIESIVNEQNILPEKLSDLEKGLLTFGDVYYQWKTLNGNVAEEGTYTYDASSSQVGTQATSSFIFNSSCTFETTITTTKMIMTYIDNQGNIVRINLAKL